jgi:hypothetical protein
MRTKHDPLDPFSLVQAARRQQKEKAIAETKANWTPEQLKEEEERITRQRMKRLGF